jgi:hypothetical protein
MGKRGPKPKYLISTDWNPNLAYAIGLLTSDGCLSCDGRHIDLTSIDKDQLQNFNKALGVDLKIGYKNKNSKSHNIVFRVQISNVLFYDFLNTIGLTKKKSLIIKKVDLPDKYFFDFLRGLFDGDGCSYSYWDKRWKSSFMFYVGFCSGSVAFIDWLRDKIKSLIKINGHVTKTKRKNFYYQLKYSKYEAVKLVHFMYREGRAIKLNRKYLKIMATLGTMKQLGEI